MLVPEVAQLFRTMVDESDTSWLTSTNVAQYLSLGYEEFRRIVAAVDRTVYEEHVTLHLSNVNLYDLGGSVNSVRVLGPSLLPVGTKRLQKLHAIVKVDDATQQVQEYYLTPARSTKDLGYFSPKVYATPTYYLAGTVLYFGEKITGYYVLIYTPANTVDWTKQASTDTEFIDDLSNFHPLIAYLGAKIYMARDGVINPALASLISDQTTQLVSFAQQQRMTETMDDVYMEY